MKIKRCDGNKVRPVFWVCGAVLLGLLTLVGWRTLETREAIREWDAACAEVREARRELATAEEIDGMFLRYALDAEVQARARLQKAVTPGEALLAQGEWEAAKGKADGLAARIGAAREKVRTAEDRKRRVEPLAEKALGRRRPRG